MMKVIGNVVLLAGMLIGWNCVGPEDPVDGLLEDLPSVVNTANVFTFNLKGNNYSFEEKYRLTMNPDSNSVLTTSLIVTGWSGNDTTRIFYKNAGDTTYAWIQINGNLTYTATDSLTNDSKYHPSKLLLEGTDFTGTMQFSIIKD